MTTDSKPRTERSHGKDEAAADTADAAMDRFRLLARKLVRVPRDELDDMRHNQESKTPEK